MRWDLGAEEWRLLHPLAGEQLLSLSKRPSQATRTHAGQAACSCFGSKRITNLCPQASAYLRKVARMRAFRAASSVIGQVLIISGARSTAGMPAARAFHKS